MAGRARRFGVGDAMTAVALAAPVFAAYRASRPAGVLVGVLLALTWHRVRALGRAVPTAGRSATLARHAGRWLESLLCALVVEGLTVVAALGAGWVAWSLVAGVVLGDPLPPPLRPIPVAHIVAFLIAVAAAAGAGARVAQAVARNVWPGPDGRVPFGRWRAGDITWLDEETTR